MKYTYDDMIEIIAKLRGENGCPWDREQTHESLKKYLLEEAYEAIEAIEAGDGNKMSDELGDVLLQITLHAQIGSENNTFNMEDIINSLCKKMILRHPHVFGETEVCNSEQVSANWDKIKFSEKGFKSVTQDMNNICKALPVTLRATKILHKASKHGLELCCKENIFDELKNGINEIETTVKNQSKESIEDKFGDLIFKMVNLSMFLNINTDLTLDKSCNLFIKRFGYLENKLANMNKTIDTTSKNELHDLWEKAKIQI